MTESDSNEDILDKLRFIGLFLLCLHSESMPGNAFGVNGHLEKNSKASSGVIALQIPPSDFGRGISNLDTSTHAAAQSDLSYEVTIW